MTQFTRNCGSIWDFWFLFKIFHVILNYFYELHWERFFTFLTCKCPFFMLCQNMDFETFLTSEFIFTFITSETQIFMGYFNVSSQGSWISVDFVTFLTGKDFFGFEFVSSCWSDRSTKWGFERREARKKYHILSFFDHFYYHVQFQSECSFYKLASISE